MSIFGDGGRAQIKVDTLGFLANNLTGYEATSILREQLQNADDACHKQGLRGALELQFLPDRLVVTNPSVFTDEDWRRIVTPATRGKYDDAEQTGEFGIGFWGSLHLTDTPVVTSGADEVTLHPVDGATRRTVQPISGTRFEFAYRRAQTEIGRRLQVRTITSEDEDRMAAVFVNDLSQLLLFTRAIDVITLTLPDNTRRRAHRSVTDLGEGVASLEVTVDGAQGRSCRYLTVAAEIPDPPESRHGRVTVALLAGGNPSSGRVFVTFATETSTGLNLSINAHFRATNDRRSLQHDGEHGLWNERIFAVAGTAVGKVIERVLDEAVTGVPYDEAVQWFSATSSSGRAGQFTRALDAEARERAVAPDTEGTLRRPDQLAYLERHIELILGGHVGDSLQPGHPEAVLKVLHRWGLRPWGPKEVATWLANNSPRSRTELVQSPEFLRRPVDTVELLNYCNDFASMFDGVAILLGTDNAYHPVGGALHRPGAETAHLLGGLATPLVEARFRNTAVARRAPVVGAAWLRAALLQSDERLAGKRVPVRSVDVASKKEHVREALDELLLGNVTVDGVPLALDEDGVLRRFDSSTVRGIPQGPGRKVVSALARRIGYTPLHPSLDDDTLNLDVDRFGLSLTLERLPDIDDWDPVSDSRLLVEALAEIERDRPISPILVEQLREQRIWATESGEVLPLTEVRLPSSVRLGAPPVPLLADALAGPTDPSAPIYLAFKKLLRVDVLDHIEEVVLECESPPKAEEQRRQLMEAFGDCDEFTASQIERLRRAAFVLCQDGQLRRPKDVFITEDHLPLSLGDRCVEPVCLERRSKRYLMQLGALVLPSADDLQAVALEIASQPVSGADPGRLLWDFLVRNHANYSAGDLSPLSETAWLATEPGPTRRMPKVCIDPQWGFARELYPVPMGVGTPAAEMREKLRMKAALDASDCVRLGGLAVERDLKLDKRFFDLMEQRAAPDSEFERVIARLRAMEILVVGDQSRVAPERTVSRAAKAIWGHLRETAPDWFIESYPNLSRAWLMTMDADTEWRDHLDVVDEIAALQDPDERDETLLRQRLASLASYELDKGQIETVRRRVVIPTSLGLRTYDETLRGDLPPDSRRRLAERLPIADEWDGLGPLWDMLNLRRLSSVVTLRVQHRGARVDGSAATALHERARSFLRCLKNSTDDLTPSVIGKWPPTVLAVNSLTIVATRTDGTPVADWHADAFLDSQPDDALVLYVRTDRVDNRAIVDAFSAAFSIDGQLKASLLLVLDAPSSVEAEEVLNWQDVPLLADGAGSMPSDDVLQFSFEQSDPTVATARKISSEQSVVVQPKTPAVSGGQATSRPAPPLSNVVQAGSYRAEAAPEAPYAAAQSPRGTTDIHELVRRGIRTVEDLETEVEESDYEPSVDHGSTDEQDEARLCLSYYDVRYGMLPLTQPVATRLASGSVDRVLLLGDEVPAQQFARHLRLEDGSMHFARRGIVPGTIVRAVPGARGSVELILREDRHRVTDVWMLELDDTGTLLRFKQDDLELTWETDDAFYRAERRLEDLNALSKDGGKSALQLIIEVFLARPSEGLTAEEVWGLVAVSRLFAKSTISQTLTQQTGLFENRGGRWFKIGNELRRRRLTAHSAAKTSIYAPPAARREEVVRMARRLVRLMASADELTYKQVIAVLRDAHLDAPDELGNTGQFSN
jgi:hypothetical protein